MRFDVLKILTHPAWGQFIANCIVKVLQKPFKIFSNIIIMTMTFTANHL